MAFRIPHNVEAMTAYRWLSHAQFNLNRSLERLSSGYRINRAADDAAGLAIANQFRQEIASLRVAYNNASQATNMIQVAEGTASKISEMVTRLKELATEAASDTVDNDRRTYLHNEAHEIIQEINHLADSTKYAGQALFSAGNASGYTFTFQVGYENATHDRIQLQIGDVHTSHLGAGGITDINLKNITSAQTALTCIDNALTSLNGVLADLGGVQNKLTYRQGKINVQIENFTASESTIRDVDMALEMANLTKNQILVQTGMAMLAQANALPQNIIQLLR